ncbi:MAG: astD [Gammaproteobacteria bacterium]|nr:astD [Gammaproteobacteria bacterium]
MKSAGHYIAGKWTQSKAGEPLQAIDSIYGLKIWQGQAMTEPELKLATTEAKAAYQAWSALDINERLKKITLLINELSKNHVELSNIMAQESGRPIWLLKESLNGLIYHLSSLAISSGRCPKGTIAICSSAISLNYIAQTFEVLLYGNSVILCSYYMEKPITPSIWQKCLKLMVYSLKEM